MLQDDNGAWYCPLKRDAERAEEARTQKVRDDLAAAVQKALEAWASTQGASWITDRAAEYVEKGVSFSMALRWVRTDAEVLRVAYTKALQDQERYDVYADLGVAQ